MSEIHETPAPLSPEQRALIAVRRMKAKIEELERVQNEPIAIIGMNCRFPGGASDPERFWELLSQGRDGVTEVPPERWDADAYYDPDVTAPGKMPSRWGGFVEQVDQFDAAFFGITPREAQYMDPQQRLLLEVAWEAFERTGQTTDQLAGSPTGVFVAICNNDYSTLFQAVDPSQFNAYLATGNAHSIVANRLSYILDLRGPSIAIDTACSSSLVALHLACQSLRQGECQMALVGGVNLILSPYSTMALAKAHMLAADGRCKTFDHLADGFVRGEGCGVVVLKRLSQAQADGD
ncbi:MAG: polyketide synthase, partial [Ktedonobacteraceae bacterium]|nr:polyketide synthase [Ktedonobacteraceae bacterium]